MECILCVFVSRPTLNSHLSCLIYPTARWGEPGQELAQKFTNCRVGINKNLDCLNTVYSHCYLNMLFSVSCKPEPELAWYYKQDKQSSSDRYRIYRQKHGVHVFEIRDLQPEDAGEWRALAFNSYGQTLCSCSINVIRKSLSTLVGK